MTVDLLGLYNKVLCIKAAVLCVYDLHYTMLMVC